MDRKNLIRKKYLKKRKSNYFSINRNFFLPLINLIKRKNIKNKNSNIALYYPSFYEVNILKILDIEFFKHCNFLLPVIEKNNSMDFFVWKKNDVLFLNKYGIPEPERTKKIIPDIILVPLLAFDKNKNRIGYGKGFYDKFLNKYLKIKKKIFTIGVAFSFQNHHNLPVQSRDFSLNHVITEKGIIK